MLEQCNVAVTPGNKLLVFLAMHYRNQLLCRLPWRTAKGSVKVRSGKQLLCRLLYEADGKGAFAISSRRQRKQTTKIALLVRQVANGRPLSSAADGKICPAFAISHYRQTDQMGQLPGSTLVCHVASLPSAADGKEPVAVGGRRQRAFILSLFSVFLVQQFSQQIYMTANIYHISST